MLDENFNILIPVQEVIAHFEKIKHEIDANTDTLIKRIYNDPTLSITQEHEIDELILNLRRRTHKTLDNTIQPYQIIGETNIPHNELLEISKSTMRAVAEHTTILKEQIAQTYADSIYEHTILKYVATYGKIVILTFSSNILEFSTENFETEWETKWKKLEQQYGIENPENPEE